MPDHRGRLDTEDARETARVTREVRIVHNSTDVNLVHALEVIGSRKYRDELVPSCFAARDDGHPSTFVAALAST